MTVGVDVAIAAGAGVAVVDAVDVGWGAREARGDETDARKPQIMLTATNTLSIQTKMRCLDAPRLRAAPRPYL